MLDARKTTLLINIVTSCCLGRVFRNNARVCAVPLRGRRRRKCKIITDLCCQISRSLLPSNPLSDLRRFGVVGVPTLICFPRPKSPFLLRLNFLRTPDAIASCIPLQNRSKSKRVVKSVSVLVGHEYLLTQVFLDSLDAPSAGDRVDDNLRFDCPQFALRIQFSITDLTAHTTQMSKAVSQLSTP